MENFEEVASLIKHKKVIFEYGTIKTESTPTVWVLKEGNFVKERKFIQDISSSVVGLANILGNTVFEIMATKNGYLMTEYWLVRDQFSLSKVFTSMNHDLLKVYYLVKKWASTGNYDCLIDLSKLKHLIPDKYKSHKVPLYRGLILSIPASKKLANDKPIKLQKRPLSSWSSNFDIAKNNASYDRPDSLGVVMTYIPKKEDVLLNINLFAKEMFGNLSYILNSHEEEIILINSSNMLVVNPEQLVYYNNDARIDEPDTLSYHEFKHRIKGSSDSDEEVLEEIHELIKDSKIKWEYGVNIPLKNVETWYTEENLLPFTKDRAGYLPTKTYGKFLYKNFTVLQEIYFETKHASYTYYAVKDTKVVFKKKLTVTLRAAS